MSKLGILLGAGVGYVLGARDGRERYEQIKQQSQRIWKDPRVQEKKEQAQGLAKQKGSEVQEKASQKAQEKSSDSTSSPTPNSAPPTGSAAGTSGASDGTSAGSKPGGMNG